ncbi:MAG TPA: hypothetical protein VLF17_05180 [Candidatus Nitrosotenuis sp.]|nr:hypothetical protein [Candidatus Nitrosotenuis sp.]
MNREDVCFLMVQVRHLIEVADRPERYRVASFYADWTVHSVLDRSPVCFEVLRDITRVLAENFNPTKPDITREVSRIIGFPQLRSELLVLFRDNDLPTILFDYRENWRSFVTFLLWFLVGQPIGFPERPTDRSKKIRDEMLSLQRPYNISVEALAIVNHEGVYHWILAVSGEKDVKMVGQIEIAETDDAFLTPPQSDTVELSNAAQHSVHSTGGTRRVFRQFVWLRVGSVKAALSRPAHPRVTLTVGWHYHYVLLWICIVFNRLE